MGREGGEGEVVSGVPPYLTCMKPVFNPYIWEVAAFPAAVALSALPGSLASAGAALLRTFATLKRWFCPESKALHLGAVAGNASETQKERVHGAA